MGGAHIGRSQQLGKSFGEIAVESAASTEIPAGRRFRKKATALSNSEGCELRCGCHAISICDLWPPQDFIHHLTAKRFAASGFWRSAFKIGVIEQFRQKSFIRLAGGSKFSVLIICIASIT